MDEDKMVFRVSILTFFRSNGKKGHLEKYYSAIVMEIFVEF